MRAVLPVLFLLAASTCAAQPDALGVTELLQGLGMPGSAPMLAQHANRAGGPAPVFALVFPTSETARLVVIEQGEDQPPRLVLRSRSFSFSRQANHGSAVEQFIAPRADELVLTFTTRAGCARGARTHRFARLDGVWWVVGLDTNEPLCTERGVETDSASSADYLAGTARTVVHARGQSARGKSARTVQTQALRRPLLLSEFPPEGPEPAYAELQ